VTATARPSGSGREEPSSRGRPEVRGAVRARSGPTEPCELRHAFITLGLGAGATLRDLQRAAAHADPRTTANCNRRRKALDIHPSYLVERFLA
jgi:integrase